jgi:hypothetical protein
MPPNARPAAAHEVWGWVRGVQVEKKPYYPVFKLCGFVGFDGDFKG